MPKHPFDVAAGGIAESLHVSEAEAQRRVIYLCIARKQTHGSEFLGSFIFVGGAAEPSVLIHHVCEILQQSGPV